MVTTVTDSQVVGETVSTLFTTNPNGPVDMLLVIKNSGVNTMNYRIQEWDGSAWVDLGASGSDYYNTLIANQVRQFAVSSNYALVQMIGNASGGAFLDFTVTKYVNRSSGGAVP